MTAAAAAPVTPGWQPPPWQRKPVQRFLKRLLDVIVAGLALVMSVAILPVLVLLVRSRLGPPALFVQSRPGLHGRPFRMFKLRSMRDAHGPDGLPLPDDQRLTPFGAWLRSTSLDELPEFWNVLKGEMSLIGPRPLLMSYLQLYDAEQRRRHEMPPGITGWAAVNGRNALSWDDKFQLDLWYVDNWSLWLDVKILLLTLWQVCKREGISQPGHVTAEPFRGSRRS
jgi:lipopolysaccharide/colanic/teichoic acid biosynthesis glycosyltransferase